MAWCISVVLSLICVVLILCVFAIFGWIGLSGILKWLLGWLLAIHAAMAVCRVYRRFQVWHKVRKTKS